MAETESYNISGSDYRRLPGPASSDAIERLLDLAEGTEHPNPHDAAALATEMVTEAEARSALRKLLALHMFNLADEDPQVAMRNVRIGDVVSVHGFNVTVQAIRNREKATITIIGRLYGSEDTDKERTFAYDRDVRIPLKRRGG